jgi:hypothetical protein
VTPLSKTDLFLSSSRGTEKRKGTIKGSRDGGHKENKD